MRMKMLAAVIGVSALGAGVLLAQEPRRADRRADRARIQAEAGLTDEQVTQIRKIHTDARKAAIQRRADMRIARMELRELMAADTLDEAQIAAKVKAISELQARAFKERTDSLIAVRKVVSAEQFQKLQQARREHRGRGGRGEHRRGPRGGGAPGGDDLEPVGQF
jgi:Spy/CpxP family protein refolding chaperone